LFDYVCKNRMVWGAEGFREIKIRHTSGAPDRWVEQVLPALKNYAHGSTDNVAAAIGEHFEEPQIVGVGVGGTADLCVHLSKVAATRALGSRCDDPEGAKLETQLTSAVNQLGVGPQGLGGDSTAFAVHVETAATHITMNPVAVNMQCHSARRARATFTPSGVEYGF
ncbi:MAG: fumarate hydratase, partial [Pseudomonadota bacterium]